jgi:hypothetical protein
MYYRLINDRLRNELIGPQTNAEGIRNVLQEESLKLISKVFSQQSLVFREH